MWSDVKRIFHFGPITALTVIKIITFTTLFLTSQWLHFTDSLFAVVNYLSYYSFIAIVLYNFFSAVFVGPGLTPLQWRPKDLEDCKYVQYCGQCEGYKPPRAHHCRRCERCVLKMDHHCPWINNCVGYRNQCYFTLFLLTAVLGSIQSLILLIVGLYRALYSNWYLYNDRPDRFVYLSMTSLLFGIFSVGLSLGVIIAVGGLLFLQIKILVRNQTSIEEWIITKAKSRKRDDVFLFPYDLGFWRNVKQVLCEASNNGFVWPVIEGCNQYTLTVEQLLQKEEKKSRSATYRAVGDYNGSWFPLFSQGWRVCISFPITDEPRIAITSGDDVLVTRWKKRWLYGEKLKICGNKRERGWFPRHIVAQVYIAKHNEQQQQVNNGSNRNFYTNVTKDDKKSD